jgi:hypothetical protein
MTTPILQWLCGLAGHTRPVRKEVGVIGRSASQVYRRAADGSVAASFVPQRDDTAYIWCCSRCGAELQQGREWRP